MRMPRYEEPERRSDFTPIARRIVQAAATAVADRLSTAAPTALTPVEFQRLRHPEFQNEDVARISGLLVNDFLTRQLGYKGLFQKAHRELAGLAISRAVTPYCRANQVSPVDYYLSKYRSLFELLDLPWRSLLFVDSNLYACMPAAEARGRLASGGRRARKVRAGAPAVPSAF